MKTKLLFSEIAFNNFSVNDDVGRIFYWKDKILRGINKNKEDLVREMFTSGMIDELINKEFIPKTKISDYETDNYSLILEHEKIPYVTYPHEWSFSMLKDVAVFILNLNKTVINFGFQTKDCHGYNVLFRGYKPLFIDIGSFIKVDSEIRSLYSYNEFMRFYYYPLKIWKSHSYYIANSIINQSANLSLLPEDYFILKYPVLKRVFNRDFIKKLSKMIFFYKNLDVKSNKEIIYKIPHPIGNIIAFFKKNKMLFFSNSHIDNLINKINKIKNPSEKTTWEKYHNEFNKKNGDIVSTDRFDKIIKIINELEVKSIVDLAGNQGVLSELIEKKNGQIHNIISTDYDQNAVDLMYQRLKKNKSHVVPLVLNFISPSINYSETYPDERFKSDLVIAMAITHHLLLSQNIEINQMFKIIKNYTRKYILIEFMPLGLWGGEYDSNTPGLPDWYNEEYFKKNFQKYFELISVDYLEKNRILYFGKIIY